MTGRVQSSPLSAPPRLTGAERNAGILARGGERLLHSPVAISSRGITHDLSWKRPIGELLYELIDIAPALHLRSLRDGRRAIRHPVPPSFSSHMHNSIHPLFVESLGGWCRSRDAAAAKRDTIVAQRGVAPVGSASATHTTPTATRQPRQAPRCSHTPRPGIADWMGRCHRASSPSSSLSPCQPNPLSLGRTPPSPPPLETVSAGSRTEAQRPPASKRMNGSE